MGLSMLHGYIRDSDDGRTDGRNHTGRERKKPKRNRQQTGQGDRRHSKKEHTRKQVTMGKPRVPRGHIATVGSTRGTYKPKRHSEP